MDLFLLFVFVPVNSYGHVGTASSPNHTFFLGKLEQAVNQYFVHLARINESCSRTQCSDTRQLAEGKRMTIEIIS